MLGFSAIRTIRGNAFGFLRQTSMKFDIIFADPPYDMEDISQIISSVFEKRMLNKDGWLIIEHPREKSFVEQPWFQEQRKYGKVNFSILNNKAGLK